MKFLIKLSTVLGSVILLIGCAAAPELQKYPRTQMQRPYTLPKQVATWTTAVPVGSIQDSTGSFFIPPIPNMLNWATSLTDDWQLNFTPLPLSISHQFSYSPEQVWGATFGSGFGYASTIGLVIAPGLHFYQRTKLGKNVALETSPSFEAQYTTGTQLFTWTVGLNAGPLFQLNDTFALSPKVGLYVDNGYDDAAVTSLSYIAISPARTTAVLMPLSLNAAWSFHRQWDLNASYTFHRIGHTASYTSHYGLLRLVHFW